jgi:hypothetical protein
MASYVEEFAGRLESAGLIPAGLRPGCTPGEIDEIMQAQQVATLPALYRDFLTTVGRNPTSIGLMVGSDWSARDLLTLKQDAEGLLAGDRVDAAFLAGSMVIQMHQGYAFLYLPAESMNVDNPPVWTYSEEELTPHGAYRSFTDFLDFLQRDVAALRRADEELRANPMVHFNELE